MVNMLIRGLKKFSFLLQSRNFSIQSILTKPVLIYEANSKISKHVRLNSIMNVFVGISSLGVTCYAVATYKNYQNQMHFFVIPCVTLVLGAAALGMALIFPIRTIQTVTLLPQNRAIIHSYGFFGSNVRSKSVVPLHDILPTSYNSEILLFKLRGKIFNHTIKLKNAKLLIPDNFNQAFGNRLR